MFNIKTSRNLLLRNIRIPKYNLLTYIHSVAAKETVALG